MNTLRIEKKLAQRLLNKMTFVDGQNNYKATHLVIDEQLDNRTFSVHTYCMNEYGSIWSNEDHQVVRL